MKSIVAKALLGTLLCLQFYACSVQAQTPQPSAEFMLQRMAETYASARSYSDSGVVSTYRNGVCQAASNTFQIFYVRPDHLRLEMTNYVGSPHFREEYAFLCSDGKETRTWSRLVPQVVTNRDVLSGVGGIRWLTGVSHRCAHNIPSLLQTNFCWQERLFEISSPTVLGDEVIDKTDCFHIEGKGRAQRQFGIWIGKADYLVRKIRTTYLDFWDEEIHQNIAVNMQVPANVFTSTLPTPNESRPNN